MIESGRRRTRIITEEPHVITAVPDSDRAHAFAARVAESVHAGTWFFGRVDADGSTAEAIGSLDAPEAVARTRVADELRMQGAVSGSLPRVTPTLTGTTPREHGLVAVYGNTDVVGVLIVERDLRAFSSSDVAVLRSSLTEGSELLARLRLVDGEQTVRQRAAERAFPANYVLDPALRVELHWQPHEDDVLHTMLELEPLPPAIRDAVRSLTASWTDDPATRRPGVAVPLPFVIVRVTPLEGENTWKIGVLIERFQARNALKWAARRFALSGRELQVLSLVLQGHGTSEIAAALSIAESTAHDHIKRMLLKTRARNRVEMAAKALGWRAG